MIPTDDIVRRGDHDITGDQVGAFITILIVLALALFA